MTTNRQYLTAFTVYLDTDLKASVHLNPMLPDNVTIERAAPSFDFDVAALWISKYKEKVA